jgi:hypothetical protein
MVRCRLRDLCGVRAGDKLDISDISLFADNDEVYALIREQVTADRVKQHFGSLVHGDVLRYEVPNLVALKFVMHQALGGGSARSLRSDTQGKTHGLSLLRMWIDVPESVLARATRRRATPGPAGGSGEPVGLRTYFDR